MRASILRMIDEHERKRSLAKLDKKLDKKPKVIAKKYSVKKTTVGWQYNARTGRYEPTLVKSKH